MKIRFLAVLALGTTLVAAIASADTIVLRNGRRLQGELIRKDQKEVVFRVIMYGAKMTKVFKPTEVEHIIEGPVTPAEKKPDKEPEKDEEKLPEDGLGMLPDPPEAPPVVEYDQPTYYLIPLEGEVGKTFLARVLKESLDDAVRRKPTVVILRVDSPGGLISECEEMIQILRRYNHRLRIVAYVRDAISAAAITSLAAREIYFEPGGTFGAAKAFRMGATGISDVDEKFRSVWRAKARGAAEIGGHSRLLAQAMIDNRLQLHWVEQDGKKVIKEGRGDNMITKRGQLLTMTAGEALACGFSSGTAQNLEDLGKRMGIGSWVECKGLGAPLAEHWQTTLKKFDEDMEELYSQYQDKMKSANEWLPWRYRGYRVISHGRFRGNFTSRSRQIWQQRSLNCSRFLQEAEEITKRAAALAKKVPEREEWSKNIEEMAKDLENLRMKMMRNKNARGPRDIVE
jgi:hypothetical protein